MQSPRITEAAFSLLGGEGRHGMHALATRQCPRPPNLRQNAVLDRQTVHVSLAVAIALHRRAAMAVAGAGAAKARPRAHSRMQHPFPANQEMPCLPV